MTHNTQFRLLLPTILCLCLGCHGAAFAQAMIAETSTDQMGALLKAEGYSFEIDPDGDFLWHLEGFRTLLLIAPDGGSMTFRAAFSDSNATLEKVNQWNKLKKYSKSYLDDAGDPVIELDLDLAGGISRERLLDFLITCRISLVEWVHDVVR